jgi:hypothetical protein
MRMAECVRSVWDELGDLIPRERIRLEVEGDCKVKAARDHLFIVVSRLLQWFTQRAIETSSEVYPSIRVRCSETPEGPQLVFEDKSRRLGAHLRERLFSPFSQAAPPQAAGKHGRYLPLYLAKMLVEVKYRGVLEDRSDELDGDVGHKFVMRFPVPWASI